MHANSFNFIYLFCKITKCECTFYSINNNFIFFDASVNAQYFRLGVVYLVFIEQHVVKSQLLLHWRKKMHKPCINLHDILIAQPHPYLG